MVAFTVPFIISQIAMALAMGTDFLSLQFKERKPIFFCLTISASLISAHYFLLGRIAAGVIVIFSVLRFITCYFTTNKKFPLIFIGFNTISLLFTYQNIYDLMIYFGLVIFIIGNFQKDGKIMRKMMMTGTSMIIIYNALVHSPMGVIAESSFLISNIVGYYRFYIRKPKERSPVNLAT